MIVGERLAERMRAAGYNQSSLARAIGVAQQTIGKLVTGQSSSSVHLLKMAQLLKTTPAYLEGETDDPSEGAFVPPTATEIAAEMGLVKISEIDLDIGMGSSFMDEAQVTEVDRWIPQEWVSNFTTTPAPLLAIARPVGESMYPTINDRDLVLIDRSQKKIDRVDGIWLLVFGGFSTIKRVRMLPDGTARLMADNPQVRDEVATDGELFVIGRVAGVFRRT